MSDDLALPADGLNQFGPQGQRMATSLDLKKQENRKLVLKCLQDCDKRLTEEVGEAIRVTDYFIHDVEIRNEKSGEVVIVPRMVLIDKAGKTHECVSETLGSSLRAVAFAYGAPPWPDGLNLVPKMKRKGERNIYFLEVK